MKSDGIEAYWQEFLATLPPDSPYRSKTYISEGWGDGPEMADELGALIAAGTKTATCFSLWEWEAALSRPCCRWFFTERETLSAKYRSRLM